MNALQKFLKKWSVSIGFVAGALVLMLADAQDPNFDFIVAVGLLAFVGNAGFLLWRWRNKPSS